MSDDNTIDPNRTTLPFTPTRPKTLIERARGAEPPDPAQIIERCQRIVEQETSPQVARWRGELEEQLARRGLTNPLDLFSLENPLIRDIRNGKISDVLIVIREYLLQAHYPATDIDELITILSQPGTTNEQMAEGLVQFMLKSNIIPFQKK